MSNLFVRTTDKEVKDLNLIQYCLEKANLAPHHCTFKMTDQGELTAETYLTVVDNAGNVLKRVETETVKGLEVMIMVDNMFAIIEAAIDMLK